MVRVIFMVKSLSIFLYERETNHRADSIVPLYGSGRRERELDSGRSLSVSGILGMVRVIFMVKSLSISLCERETSHCAKSIIPIYKKVRRERELDSNSGRNDIEFINTSFRT